MNFYSRLLQLVLFLIPLSYLGSIFAVSLHEIVGHGLGSLLVGGNFVGFRLHLDGMGSAWTPRPEGCSTFQEVFILSAGIGVTLIAGIVFLYLALIFRKRPSLSLILITFAATCLLDGAPYLLWSSYVQQGNGDPFRILRQLDSSQMRWAFMAAGAVLTAGSIFVTNLLFFKSMGNWLSPSKDFERKEKWMLLALLLVGNAGNWLLFDWDQLAPGAGLLPAFVGIVFTILTLGVIHLGNLGRQDLGSELVHEKLPIVKTWAFAGATVLAIVLWFSEGVHWG